MTDIERVKTVIDWLVFAGSAKNKRELAKKTGYTESYVSQILNGKVVISEQFIKKLGKLNNTLNIDWLLTGEGEMLRKEQTNNDETISTDVSKCLDIIKEKDRMMYDLLKEKDAQMSRLITIIEKLKGKD